MARPRTFDEAAVLEEAVQVFRESGYEGTSVPDLTEKLGICRQSLYTTFGDKRGLYLKALERWGEREVDAKVALLNAPGSPLENLRTVVRGWADLATRCPSEGCLTAAAIVEARGETDALEVVQAQVARLERGFVRTLTKAMKRGELKPTAHPERIAHALITFAYGVGVLSRLETSGPRIADAVSVLLSLIHDAAA